MLATRALATTYYIDFENGDDTLAGTSDVTAWKHCPNDSRATGVAASQAIVGGDVLAFRRGTTYQLQTQLYVKGGSVGNPVVYDGDVWGTGAKATLTGNNTTVYGFRDNGKTDNVTIRNFTIQDLGGYSESSPVWTGIEIASIDTGTNVITTTTDHQLVVGDDVQFTTTGAFPTPLVGGTGLSVTVYYVISIPTSTSFIVSTTAGGVAVDITGIGTGTLKAWEPITAPPGAEGIEFYDGSDNILIENITLTEIGQWQNQPPMRGTNSVTGLAIKLQNNNNVTVRNCDISKTRVGINLAAYTGGPLENILVENCDIHDYIVWGIDMAPRATGSVLQNIEIRRTKIRDYHHHDAGSWQGFGEKPHTDGMFIRTANISSTWTNVLINGCEFYKDNPGSSAGGTASIYVSQGPSVTIANCLFVNDRHARAIDSIGGSVNSSQTVRVYNNTFVNCPQIVFSNQYGMPNRQWHVANNLFLKTNTTASNSIWVSQSNDAMTDLDHNVYWNPLVTEAANKAWILNPGGSYLTLANVRFRGWETNGVYDDPLLTNTTGVPSTMNLRPLAGSALINAGKNLSAYFTTDKDGNARPAVGAWTVGAYEYDGSPPADVTAPTLLTASINSIGNELILTFDEPVQGVAQEDYLMSGNTLGDVDVSGTIVRFSITPLVQIGAIKSLSYTQNIGNTRDLADNSLVDFTGFAITNNSLELTPDPAKPGKKNRGKAGIISNF